jgi:hypothetical protein
MAQFGARFCSKIAPRKKDVLAIPTGQFFFATQFWAQF